MKRISVVLWLTLVTSIPASAINTVEFSTAPGTGYSWQLANVGGTWQFTFVPGATIVTDSTPSDAVLIGDYVDLPTMTLTNITTTAPGILTATLTPAGDLTIHADVSADATASGDTVLTASVGTGAFITAGTNFIAYSTNRDDLDILSSSDDYGATLPLIAAADTMGLLVDLSFSGESQANLFNILSGADVGATANGDTCGSISVLPIPAPQALLLAAMGTAVVGWFRHRQFI
jgi:hypothetical protein